jgi:cellulose synthase/poly-beta-1,6-N-acetylglucosamine synthase-like glycosyltransferase
MAFISRKKVKIQEIYPNVTLIIAAYNKEKVIEAKIRNCFELDYPKDLMDVIIVSDGSTDSTPSIVNKYSDKGIQGLFQPERRGKTAALNRAVEKAKGDIIIFSDANSMFGPQSIKLLIRNFADLSVGGVCGRKSILKTADRESSRGDSLFWDFESVLKTMQSHAGSISNGDGEIFALRRSLYKEIPEKIINDDQAITFNIIKEGYRVIYEPEAISNEEASIILEDDFRSKPAWFQEVFRLFLFIKNFYFRQQVILPSNSFHIKYLDISCLFY